MNKNEFIIKLIQNLSSLPQAEIEDRVSFYSEMIADRMEEGLSEEEAVASLGSIQDIIDQSIADTPLITLIKERVKRRKKLGGWGIALLAIGSPIWTSLIAAAFAVVVSLYASIWSVVVSLWASFGAMVGVGVGGVLGGILFITLGKFPAGFGILGCGLACGGLSILMFYACKYTTIAMLWLTKKLALLIKKCFTKKEDE